MKRTENEKAAMYVRMSTDHQKYSTENQADAIRDYAERHKLNIIETYADEGKSGLNLDGRHELKRMLEDVDSGRAKYTKILVLDISRWGRFQDADESAFYEYACRRTGINVEYVAEQFENDGSPTSNIIKSVKRSMAGEYSRELSRKVFSGQCRLIELGFRQGGPAGFGLRRMLVDESGNRKGELNPGEHKSIQTDRIILVPGPQEEVEIVKWMYRSFIKKNKDEGEIAQELNERGVLRASDCAWTRGSVHQVLTNEKYIGNNVFNRTSNKLKNRRTRNAPDMWVRSNGAFEAIVNVNDFYVVQGILRERSRRFSDGDMLEKLEGLFQTHGSLSGIVIDEQEGMPSSSAYQYRFGSLLRAYKLVGYTPDRDYRYIEINKRLRKFHADTLNNVISIIHSHGLSVVSSNNTGLLLINDELKVSIVVSRCFQTPAGAYRWKIHLDLGLNPDLTIAIRMDSLNESPLDYYILPTIDIQSPKIKFSEGNKLDLEAYRVDDLESFFKLVDRVNIAEAA